MNHTPLPWNYQVTLSKAVVIWGDEKRITPLVATMDTTNHKLNEANARFIVRACNSYEAMKAALIESKRLIEKMYSKGQGSKRHKEMVLVKINDALAIAEGKESNP